MSPVLPPPVDVQRVVEASAPGIYRQVVANYNEAGRGIRGAVISWWRDPERNARVGGARDSQHLLGTAVDSVHQSPDEAGRFASRLRARGFIALVKGPTGRGRWAVHAQAWRAGTARRAGLLDALGL